MGDEPALGSEVVLQELEELDDDFNPTRWDREEIFATENSIVLTRRCCRVDLDDTKNSPEMFERVGIFKEVKVARRSRSFLIEYSLQCPPVQAVIFVVDSADRTRLSAAKALLDSVLERPGRNPQLV
jgi:hypothetical protein